MAQAYGLWPGVVAIAADANLFCIPCAMRFYGEEVIQAVIAGEPGWQSYTDHEGNPFTPVLRGAEDLHYQYCGGGGCTTHLCDEDCRCYRASSGMVFL
ncbi:hypothetical protein KSC_086730 [Ktedonobacter sp. SOSP1-52]|uniref:hypothetical protein n=1 Tax=Ktedonobacter sp. SOSP1-52 TaxID=2778366 RepID=UPI001916907B|nr:hypothetical protein [Ktedonobacter sp. SOSP1-52]GHO69781.1 hypothetical protein KSC_086730 [Ktedonobacter sp. SOSP1-52]